MRAPRNFVDRLSRVVDQPQVSCEYESSHAKECLRVTRKTLRGSSLARDIALRHIESYARELRSPSMPMRIGTLGRPRLVHWR